MLYNTSSINIKDLLQCQVLLALFKLIHTSKIKKNLRVPIHVEK